MCLWSFSLSHTNSLYLLQWQAKREKCASALPCAVLYNFHGLNISSPSICNKLNKIFKGKKKRSTYEWSVEAQSSFSPLSHLSFSEWFLRGRKKTKHLKYILGPDPSPTASSFLQWSRQKALKQALWDNSCISFPLSTFMLQEIKVLEVKGFITQLNFLFCPDHVFIWLDFASLFFSEINLPSIWYNAKDLDLTIAL